MSNKHVHPTFAPLLDALSSQPALDPRDPDHSRTGIFVYHNCSYCRSGELPCKQGHPNRCEYPHARND